MADATPTQRHLDMLDGIAEAGMVLLRKLTDLPPLAGQNIARYFENLRRRPLLSASARGQRRRVNKS